MGTPKGVQLYPAGVCACGGGGGSNYGGRAYILSPYVGLGLRLRVIHHESFVVTGIAGLLTYKRSFYSGYLVEILLGVRLFWNYRCFCTPFLTPKSLPEEDIMEVRKSQGRLRSLPDSYPTVHGVYKACRRASGTPNVVMEEKCTGPLFPREL